MTALSLDGADRRHIILGKANGTGGLYSYVGPGLSEDAVTASVRVAWLSFRVASAGGPVLMYTTPTAPKGIYLTKG